MTGDKVQVVCSGCAVTFEILEERLKRKQRWGSLGNFCRRCAIRRAFGKATTPDATTKLETNTREEVSE